MSHCLDTEHARRRFGQAEVQQFGSGGRQHNVSRLEIAVHNAGAMGFFQRVANLYAALQRLLQGQRALRQAGIQTLALDKFHHEIVSAILVANIMQHTNMGMVQRGNGAGFALETLLGLRVRGKMCGQDFDGDGAVEPGIARPIHFAHAAGAQRRLNFIRAEFGAGG
jgi:hypothetical protein